MKNTFFKIIVLFIGLSNFTSFSQTENDTPLLGLPGDDLDLYAVLDLFQKSKTIENFEKSLNDEKSGIVNLDLNNDGNVDFIKVTTEQNGDDFLFVLQDHINEKETQDIAVIAVSKDDEGKISMQIIGDEKLYGKDYVVEPRSEPTESITANPAYKGEDPVTVNVQGTTEVIVVQSAPVVQYVYSPAYVPYYPPYYYGYYPPYWRPFAVVAIGIYRHNHWHHHGHYHGGHASVNININNRNTINHYNKNTRKTSNTVNNNIKNGNFKTSGQAGSRPSTSQTSRTTNRANTTNNRTSTSNRPSTTNRASTNNKTTRPSTNQRSTSPSTYNRSSGSRTMSSRPSTGTNRSYGGRVGGGRRR